MSKEREPLVTHIYTADPSAHVYNDKIYIYPSHDIPHDGMDNDDGDEYQMLDYHVLTMDSIDAECIDHGEALHVRDVPWARNQMWAPDVVYKNGKYYLVFPARDKEGNFRLGIATGEEPEGPFTYQGRILEPVIGWTTHHSIVEFEGKWYLFYHDCELSKGINHRRTVKFTELHYNEDGSIQTIFPYEDKGGKAE